MLEKIDVGIDVVEIKKFQEKAFEKNVSFYEKIFNKNEIEKMNSVMKDYLELLGYKI